MPCARFATTGAPKGRPTKPDARGARYQLFSFPPSWSKWDIRPRSTAPGRKGIELRATLRKPAIAERLKPYKAGCLVNEMKGLAEDVGALPRVQRSPDPTGDFLPALSAAGKADYLVTGDKGGLLALARHHSTRIVSARAFAALFA